MIISTEKIREGAEPDLNLLKNQTDYIIASTQELFASLLSTSITKKYIIGIKSQVNALKDIMSKVRFSDNGSSTYRYIQPLEHAIEIVAGGKEIDLENPLYCFLKKPRVDDQVEKTHKLATAVISE